MTDDPFRPRRSFEDSLLRLGRLGIQTWGETEEHWRLRHDRRHRITAGGPRLPGCHAGAVRHCACPRWEASCCARADQEDGLCADCWHYCRPEVDPTGGPE